MGEVVTAVVYALACVGALSVLAFLLALFGLWMTPRE